MRRVHIIFSLVLILSVAACKSSKKQFKKGNYEAAVLLAVKKLRSKPDHSNSKVVLKEAYKAAQGSAIASIELKKSSNDEFKWDAIIDQYRRLNVLYTELLRCSSCLNEVSPKSYQLALNKALDAGAEVHFKYGKKLLVTKEKSNARLAYLQFKKTLEYKSNYTGAENLLNESIVIGREIIALSSLPVASGDLELSSQFFVQQMVQSLNRAGYFFASFYSLNELNDNKLKYDQLVDIKFDGYSIGQTYVKEKVENLARDSVQVTTIKDSLGIKQPVYGSVEAELHLFYKSIESYGLLDLKIINPTTDQIVYQNKFPGSAVWEYQWGFYQGDKRALTKGELQLCQLKEQLPPVPQELFIAFTEPIFDQVLYRLKSIFKNLR